MYKEASSYPVDLGLPEDQRWLDIIRKERKALRLIVRAAFEDFEGTLGTLKIARALFSTAYKISGGRYVGEMKSFARAMNMDLGAVIMMNCSYELSHITNLTPLGCTAAVKSTREMGPIHVRSMDWPIPAIGDATRIFHFYRRDKLVFVSVGILGFVGVLSGMRPGKFSVTINWAPPMNTPRFNWGPSFLLREVMETCETYYDAVAILSNTPLATSVFYVVCGTRHGESCVIERTPRCHRVRDASLAVQANHHVHPDFSVFNGTIKEAEPGYMSLFEDSRSRAGALRRAMAPGVTDLLDAVSRLSEQPVQNEDSYQQMAFAPRLGAVLAWRKPALLPHHP
jgi:acid ceramidase/N-acylethanolamine-hydrolysing acid amidase